MIKASVIERIWKSESGHHLLRDHPEDGFVVMKSWCTPAELAELGEAIADALKDEPLNAQKDL